MVHRGLLHEAKLAAFAHPGGVTGFFPMAKAADQAALVFQAAPGAKAAVEGFVGFPRDRRRRPFIVAHDKYSPWPKDAARFRKSPGRIHPMQRLHAHHEISASDVQAGGMRETRAVGYIR